MKPLAPTSAEPLALVVPEEEALAVGEDDAEAEPLGEADPEAVLDAEGVPATRSVTIEEHGLRERTIDFVLDRHPAGTLLHLDVSKANQRARETHQLAGTPFDLVASLFFIRFQPLDRLMQFGDQVGIDGVLHDGVAIGLDLTDVVLDHPGFPSFRAVCPSAILRLRSSSAILSWRSRVRA